MNMYICRKCVQHYIWILPGQVEGARVSTRLRACCKILTGREYQSFNTSSVQTIKQKLTGRKHQSFNTPVSILYKNPCGQRVGEFQSICVFCVQTVQRGAEAGCRWPLHRQDWHHHPHHRHQWGRSQAQGRSGICTEKHHSGEGQNTHTQVPETVWGIQRKIRFRKYSFFAEWFGNDFRSRYSSIWSLKFWGNRGAFLRAWKVCGKWQFSDGGQQEYWGKTERPNDRW